MNKSILPIIKSYKFGVIRVISILILLAFFESISLALLPLSLSFFVDSNAINSLPKILINLLGNFTSARIGIYFSIFILISFILKNYLSIIAAKYTTRITCSLKDDWRIKLLDNYINSNIIEINSIPTGLVVENIINQSELAAKFIKTIIKTISYLIISLSLILSLFITSFKITFITGFIFILIGYLSSFPIKEIASRIGRKSLKYRQSISKTLNDYLVGILQVKIFSLEEKLKDQILNESKLQSSYTEKSSIISQIPSLIGSIALVLILILVFISSWKGNDMNITLIATFILISQKLQIYIANLLQSYSSLRTQKASFDLVQDLIKNKSTKNQNYEKNSLAKKIKINSINSVKFENVSFSYSEKSSILKDVNFDLTSGDLIYIFGESGCGKSTIVNLASGLMSRQKGRIVINEYPIENIDLNQYLSKISYVSQDNFLFNESIFNNLTLGKKDIQKDWIIKCCKDAGAHNFIVNLPNSYQTIVGDRGFNLSGGQIQRICIARAFIKNGDLMIFDEATSALDKRNEELIFKAIKRFTELGKIVVIISHKIQTNFDGSKSLSLEKQ